MSKEPFDWSQAEFTEEEIDAAKKLPALQFHYINHNGIHGTRTVHSIRIVHGVSKYYTTPRWLMIAWDVDKQAVRNFDLKKIIELNND